MKIVLVLLALAAAACKPSRPAAQASAPSAESPTQQNRVEKYVGGLQADVKRAQEAKEKADTAIKKAQEGLEMPE